VGCTCKQPTP